MTHINLYYKISYVLSRKRRARQYLIRAGILRFTVEQQLHVHLCSPGGWGTTKKLKNANLKKM
jgi:hypothetical protein